MNDQPQVTVVDALMGAGKTTLAIRMMDDIARSFETLFEDGAHRFVYITPFLEEVGRIKAALMEHTGHRIAFDPVTSVHGTPNGTTGFWPPTASVDAREPSLRGA